MKKVSRGDLLDLGAYEAVRERYRARIVAEKKRRRFAVTPELTMVFENTDTVLFQIQEMLRTERIVSEPAIRHELETYNELVPEEGELSVTMFVEIVDRETRDRRLRELSGLEQSVFIEVDGVSTPARAENRAVVEGPTTAVHYLKFPIGAAACAALAAGTASNQPSLHVVVRHPALEARTAVPLEVQRALAADFAP
ncbi:MAG TPA: DUF3501 family protein [Polyangia bacterium]